MQISLGNFGDQLSVLADVFDQWETATDDRLYLTFQRIVGRWRDEATRRVPVDKSTLVQRVLANVDRVGQHGFVGEVGSNVVTGSGFSYPTALEFGTKFIAGGAVKRLGTDPQITDADAIKSWPAKDNERLGDGRSATGEEQMPWLRPAWNAIEGWAIDGMIHAVRPPKQ